MLSRRLVMHAALLTSGFIGAAWAQAAFPSKPLGIVVPFGAGGVADLTARAVAQQLSVNLGQPVVIDNRPGAGGIVAAELVAKVRAKEKDIQDGKFSVKVDDKQPKSTAK